MAVPVLVDSNVILHVLTADARWFEWSARALEQWSDTSTLVINPLSYAEVSIGFERIEEMDDAMPPDYFSARPSGKVMRSGSR